MSSQVFGNLMGAFVLANLTYFTFYIVMTGLCIGASFFFLLLSQPEAVEDAPDAQNNKEAEPETSVSQDIKETWDLFISKRMLCLMPLIIQSAFNLGIQASVFVKMMESTMKTDAEGWDSSKRD